LGGEPSMAEYTQEELMAKVLEVLTTKDKMKNKEIATILDVKKKEVDLAVNELAKEGKVEFLYLGTSYVTLPKA
jgi:Mn-dependent DtxR family transcriptional regulator